MFAATLGSIVAGEEAAEHRAHCWIIGSIRLDGRNDLKAALGLPGPASDGALCLEAYLRWKDRFAEHLAGDFAFALWDNEQKRLLAVRDQLGIRPLFHARCGGSWLVSDSLEWLAARPDLDRRLDDIWIADFLATGHSLDPDRTVYAAVHRVPPGHCLLLTRDRQNLHRYWHLEVQRPLFLRDGREYGARFRALTETAIRDRLGEGRLGISMSGGLDSTALAALSVDAAGDASRVTARCAHFERLMADDEPRYARLAADALGIELYLDNADEAYDPLWRERGIRTPEPSMAIVNAHNERALAGSMAAQADIWLFGEGPDNALVFEREVYLGWLMRTGQWWRAAAAATRYLWAKACEPRSTEADEAASDLEPALPLWLAPDLTASGDLRERVHAFWFPPPAGHPWHPRAIASFGTPVWQTLLGLLDADRQYGVVWRHPYLDLRVLEFLLSVPPVPWARRKRVMREAMAGRLPAELLARRKTPLVADPLERALAGHRLPPLEARAELARWIDLDQLPQQASGRVVAVHALDYWLRGSHSA